MLFQTNHQVLHPPTFAIEKNTYPHDGNLHLYWCFIFQPAILVFQTVSPMLLWVLRPCATWRNCHQQLPWHLSTYHFAPKHPSHQKGSIQLEVANTIWWRLIFRISRFQCQVSWGRFLVDDPMSHTENYSTFHIDWNYIPLGMKLCGKMIACAKHHKQT